ncbi:unnamed protein product [Polarella glacialis]|uniref:Uncharacterized protein n=1 Tax=Polarella glacialis TaxID=89957 RepID=A0A813DT67_POLGL|nr:unnamed protein product [Polarella glacialis]
MLHGMQRARHGECEKSKVSVWQAFSFSSMNSHWCSSRYTTKNDGMSVEIVRQRFAQIFLTMPDAVRAASLGNRCGPESVYGEALADHAASLENHCWPESVYGESLADYAASLEEHCGPRFVYGEALADHAATLENHCGPESVHGEVLVIHAARLENHCGPESVYSVAFPDRAASLENHFGPGSVHAEAWVDPGGAMMLQPSGRSVARCKNWEFLIFLIHSGFDVKTHAGQDAIVEAARRNNWEVLIFVDAVCCRSEDGGCRQCIGQSCTSCRA